MNNKIILCIMFVLMLNISVVSGENGSIILSDTVYTSGATAGNLGSTAFNFSLLKFDNTNFNSIIYYDIYVPSLSATRASNYTSFEIISGGTGSGIFSYDNSDNTVIYNFTNAKITGSVIVLEFENIDVPNEVSISSTYTNAGVGLSQPVVITDTTGTKEPSVNDGKLHRSLVSNSETVYYNISYVENDFFTVNVNKLQDIPSKIKINNSDDIEYCGETAFSITNLSCYEKYNKGIYINASIASGTYQNLLINSSGVDIIPETFFSSDSEGLNVINTASIGDFIYLNYENVNYQPLDYTYEWYILKDNITQVLGGSFLEQDLNKFINLNNFDVGSYTVRIYAISYATSEGSIISSNSIILTEPAYTMSFSKDFYSIGETVIINYNVPTPTRLHLTDLFGDVITCKICYETVNGTGTLNYTLLDSDILGEYYLSGAIIKNGITLIGQYMEVIPNEDTFIGSVITDKNSYNLSEEIIINYTSNTASSLELRDSNNNNIVFGSSLFNLNGSYNLNVLNTWIIGTYTLNLYASSDGSYIDHTTFIITSQEIIFNTDKDIYYTGERLHITYAVNNNSILYLYDNENNLLHTTNLDYDGSFYNYFIPFSDTVKYPNWRLSLFDSNNLSNNISKNILVYSIIDTATPTATETVSLPDAEELPSLIEIGDSVSVFVFGEVDIDNDGIDDSDIKGTFKKVFTTLMLLAFILLLAGIRKIFK